MKMKQDIKQHDKTDCAAACIASIARRYGYRIPLTIIREASGTGRGGTTIKGIIDACGEIGFSAKAFKSPEADINPLYKVQCPVILHLLKENGDLHFVVLYAINTVKATIMDPAEGTRCKIKTEQLRKEWSGYIVTMIPDTNMKISNTHPSLWIQCLSLLRLVKKDLILSLAGALVYIIIGISTALFLQHIIDNVLPAHDIGELSKVGTVMTLLMISALFIGYCRIVFSLRAGINVDSRIILKYMSHLLKLPLSFFSQRGTGELNSRIGDAMKIRSFLIDGLTGIFISILTLSVSFALMFTYYWKLALLTLIFIPLYITLYLISNKINKRANRDIIENAARFEEKTVESITAVRSIKYFGNEETYLRMVEKQYVTLADKIYKGGKYIGIFATSSDAISKLLTIVLLIIGSLFIFNGELSVGELISFYTMTAYFSSPLSKLVNINSEITDANISAERIFDILNLEPEGTHTIEFPLEKSHDIVFRDVTFSYPGNETLLKNFNLTIEKGKITAIKGASGCGKSSIASLIMRGYKVQQGKILLNGTDINLIDLEQWRSFVSIVPQESDLMSCNILENVTGLQADPDIEKVISILEELGLRNFIASLPMGILTKIGEQGSRLSGGQKQRIALARALYREPQILILDEATSSLDDESQQYILNKMISLRNEGKSIIMISHKADNINIADTIIDMSAHSA